MTEKLTWKKFKEMVEKQGVKEEDEIWYIDVSTDIWQTVLVEKHENLGYAIVEG